MIPTISQAAVLPTKPAFSGLTAQTKQVPIPPDRYDYIGLVLDYTVTDATIEAGENMNGWLKSLKIGENGNFPVYVETNELDDILDAMYPGVTTGASKDDLPTTATAHVAYFIFKGPFQLGAMPNPYLELAVRAITAEFPSASAMEATLSVFVVRSAEEIGNGAYWNRYLTPIATQHDIPLGASLVKDVFLKSSAAMTKVSLAQTVDGKKASTMKALDIDDITPFEASYAGYKSAAYAANSVLIPSVNSLDHAGRALHVEMASGTVLMLNKSIVKG